MEAASEGSVNVCAVNKYSAVLTPDCNVRSCFSFSSGIVELAIDILKLKIIFIYLFTICKIPQITGKNKISLM